jgi:methionyl-tRNA formyltransferase
VQVMLPQAAKPRISLMSSDAHLTVLPNVAALTWSAGAALVETSWSQLTSLPKRFAFLRQGLAVSACFPWKLPPEVLEAPRLGCVNIHPSLLPRHRGPDPLFWTFRDGDRQTGVTIHQMTAELDAGPILVQRRIDLPLESRYDDADRQTIELGSKLIVQIADSVATGMPHAFIQPETNASYESHPGHSDLELDPTWPAERAFRFVHGVGPSYGPLRITLAGGESVPVIDAEAMQPGRLLGNPVHRSGKHVSIQFNDGVVTFLMPDTGEPDTPHTT